jgi:hypothetical protein
MVVRAGWVSGLWFSRNLGSFLKVNEWKAHITLSKRDTQVVRIESTKNPRSPTPTHTKKKLNKSALLEAYGLWFISTMKFSKQQR